MRSLKVHWLVGFKQKQWLAEEVFWNIINIQTYNWTKYALCESTVSGGLQAEAMGFRRSFSKHYTYSRIQLNNVMRSVKSTLSVGLQAEILAFRRIFSEHYTYSNIQSNKVCILWKYTEWWASSRSNGFQKKFFKTLQTFKHTIERSKRSVKIHWAVGFKQKQWLSEEVFWKHYTNSNLQLNKVCILWKYTEWWASSRSNGFHKKFFKSLYIFKHTIQQRMLSVKVHWVVGFKQKQWLAEEVFWNILHIQTYNWTKYAFCEGTLSVGLQAEAMGFTRSFSNLYKYSSIQFNNVCSL